MIRTLLATLALAWALSLQPAPAAAYFWKGDLVGVRSACWEHAAYAVVAEAYTRSTQEGLSAWDAAAESGACVQVPSDVSVVLGDLQSTWQMVDGRVAEIWESFDADGYMMYIGLLKQAYFGPHDMPYAPPKPSELPEALELTPEKTTVPPHAGTTYREA